jgi:colanic acid biosynthesis glycosyl transferase WcaI
MNILIATQVYPPEGHPTAIMIREVAEELSRRGAEVTVATGYPHHPYGRLYPGYRKKLLTVEENNGFRVARGWHLIHPSPSVLVRGLVMASQCGAFYLGAAVSPRPDVVLSYGPPLLGPLTSALIARASEARLVTVIYDFYPDVAVESGHLRQPHLIRAARVGERLMYRLSDRIVVLSEGFRRTLVRDKGVAPEKVAVIPVWLDAQDIVPGDRDNSWRREMGIGPETFVALYAGTIGLVSGAEVILAAARSLAAYPDILFLLVGAGQAKDDLEARAGEERLSNIRFLPFQPRERLSEMQAAADVSLVTLAPGRGKTSVPSKVLGYMAAARPVIAAVDPDCDTAQLIREAGCGLATPPGDGELLAAAILDLYNDAAWRQEMGQRGRAYFETHLEKRQVLDKYCRLLEQLIDERGNLR